MQLQEIYQKCEKIRWYKPCLEMISEDYQLSYDELLEVIRRYMVEELKEEESEFIELLKQIKAREIFGDFINFSLKKPEDYLLVQWYYENKANKVEQQAFENIVLFIGRSVYLELLKNNEALEVIPKKYNLSVEQIKKFYQYFCDKKLTKKRKETLNNILKNNLSESKKSLNNFKKSKFYKLCNMLLSDIPIEEIVKYINKNKLTLRLFYPEYIRKFLGVYKLEKVDIKEIEKQILTRYQKVVELMRSTRLDSSFKKYSLEELNEAKMILTRIIYSEKPLELPDNINEILQIVRMYDPKLNQLYFGIIDVSKSILKLVDYLKNGYHDRQFDILDYYLEIQVPPLKIINYISQVPEEFQNMIQTFFMNNRITQVSPEVILKQKYFRSDPWSSIPSEEEKKEILAFFIQNNIPISLNLFYIAYQRYINKMLYDESPKKNVAKI